MSNGTMRAAARQTAANTRSPRCGKREGGGSAARGRDRAASGTGAEDSELEDMARWFLGWDLRAAPSRREEERKAPSRWRGGLTAGSYSALICSTFFSAFSTRPLGSEA